MNATTEITCRIPADHPSLPGHFPGRPIVPGVVLLDEVVAAISAWQGRPFVPAVFPAVKFLAPLAPEQSFTIHLRRTGDDIHFECVAAGQPLARGSVRGQGAT
jgi:3-hydroxyacyl-[acyl-carrier-protein] dehydratase